MQELVTAAALTMSTLEIAGLTGKRHQDVLRDARNVSAQLGTGFAQFCAKIETGKAGRPSEVLNLPKRECLILVSGYSVELRARIIDRWMELEGAVAQAPPPGGDIGTMLSLQAMIDRRVDEALTLRLSRGAVLRPGKTAGALWREFGFPAIKGVSHWFGNRLEIAGCSIEGRGELGLTISRLFDPDKARLWINNGGRFLVEQKIAERRGQGKLHLVGAAS